MVFVAEMVDVVVVVDVVAAAAAAVCVLNDGLVSCRVCLCVCCAIHKSEQRFACFLTRYFIANDSKYYVTKWLFFFLSFLWLNGAERR